MDKPVEEPIVAFTVVDDGAIARLCIRWLCEPDALDEDELIELARTTGLLVDERLVQHITAAIDSFRADRRDLEMTVAESIPEVVGIDGRLEWVADFDPERMGGDAPDENESGRVDYYNRITYIRVSEGTHIATLHEPTKGEEGRDVCGNSIPAQPGRPCDVQIDASLAVDREGRIVSKNDGVLEWADNRMKISRLLEVPGWVDFSTGNIDFDGTVTVREGVRAGFRVRTTEAIAVEGAVEPSRLECDGNLALRHGMSGKDRGTLRVGEHADVGHLDFVRGAVRGDLVVHRELVNCRLAVGGDLLADAAVIMGGDVTVLGSARIGQLGSPRGRPTTLLVGERAGLLRLTRLAGRLEVPGAVPRGDGGASRSVRPVGPQRQGDRREIESRIRGLKRSLEWCLAQREDPDEERIEGEVEILRTLHAEIHLLFGGFELHTTKTVTGPLTIRWHDLDEPEITGAGGPARPLREVMEVRLPAA